MKKIQFISIANYWRYHVLMKLVFFLVCTLLTLSSKAAINELEFNSIIDRVSSHYKKQFSKKFPLVVLRSWLDPEDNAFAESREGENPALTFFGGFARHKEITPDAFALLVCHEMGHLLGGAPQMRSSPSPYFRPMAAEGQSDYFAPFCFKAVFSKDPVVEVKTTKFIEHECRIQWKREADARVCMRIVEAGIIFVKVAERYEIVSRDLKIDVETPDPTVATFFSGRRHPGAQCRLDTIFQAALCIPRFDEKISFAVETSFYCDTRRGDSVGTRPLCWFKPNN